MTAYEYKRRSVSRCYYERGREMESPANDTLKEMGDLGWELCAVSGPYEGGTMEYIFKRAAGLPQSIKALIDTAVEAERNRIAELVESYKQQKGLSGWNAWPQQVGLEIRASGHKEPTTDAP